jgi:MFS family permease
MLTFTSRLPVRRAYSKYLAISISPRDVSMELMVYGDLRDKLLTAPRIRSFGVPQNAVGKWAGICAAVFSISQATFGVAWGRFSDTHGRKPAILLGLTATMITSLMWGFSTNLVIAITARVLAGAGNGNVGIIRTTVAEMVPFKELQPRAFSLMPLVWNIGSIFGPSIGGALANPLDVRPGQEREGGSLFEKFPYALPNIVSAVFFATGITTGLLYLEETLETKQGQRDYGLVIGRKLNAFVKRCMTKLKEVLRLQKPAPKPEQAESEPLIKRGADDEEQALLLKAPVAPRAPPPTWREVLNYQANMNLFTYTLLAAHAMAFDQLLPVFMQYPPLEPDSQQSNPFQFAGGFGLHHFTIGLLSTCYGIFGMLVQFFLFPQVARKYGILRCLRWCACIFPFCYLAMPFTALLPTQTSRVSACFAIMLVKCLCGIFAFPCSTILLTNSASSLRVLGTLNGFATSFSAIGRALGPLLAGGMFTVGVNRGYILAPWWLLAGIGFIAVIPSFYLVEGEGFGGDENEEGEISDEDDEVDDVLQAEALGGEAEAAGGKPGPVFMPSSHPDDEAEEEGYGGVGPLLSRTTTRSSTGISPAAEATNDAANMSPVGSRRGSRSEQGGRRVTRRMSIPLGLGKRGISRKYSSNLGQSLGSAGSFHG